MNNQGNGQSSQPNGTAPPYTRGGPMAGDMWREASLNYARKFWEADSRLSVEQRQKLHSAFWMQTTLVPFLGLPVIYAGIMLPTWLKRAGRLNPKKTYRGMQVVLGLTGAFLGQGVARATGYGFYSMKFSNDQESLAVWRVLGRIGPQIGSRYYKVTARDPKQAMRNPDVIDWSRELAFPFNLIEVGAPRRGHMGAQPWPLPQQRQGENKPSEYKWPGSSPKSEEEPESSESQYNERPVAPGPAWGTQRRMTAGNSNENAVHSDAMAEKQNAFDRTMDNARDAADNLDAEERQRMFDELLVREREGQGNVDDFTQSEKKWN